MLTPSDVLNEVRHVLDTTVNLLSAYQILEELPQRDQIRVERAHSSQYTAAHVVTNAALLLVELGEVEYSFVDTRYLTFEVVGQPVPRSDQPIAFYRRRRN